MAIELRSILNNLSHSQESTCIHSQVMVAKREQLFDILQEIKELAHPNNAHTMTILSSDHQCVALRYAPKTDKWLMMLDDHQIKEVAPNELTHSIMQRLNDKDTAIFACNIWTEKNNPDLKNIEQALQHSERLNELIDATATNSRGYSQLHIAVQYDDLDSAARTIQAGANITKPTPNGNTPLHLACSHNNRPMVQLLIEAGAPLKVTNKDGNTPFLTAVQCGDHQMITFLLQQGARVNNPDRSGMTPLHYACMRADKALVDILLEHGADPQLSNYIGTKPIDCVPEDHKFAIGKSLAANHDAPKYSAVSKAWQPGAPNKQPMKPEEILEKLRKPER